MLTDDQAKHVLAALDALDELEAAAVKLVRAELAAGVAVDGLLADPMTEGTRLDVLCVADTMAVDLLLMMGHGPGLASAIEKAEPSAARDAIAEHLASRRTG